MDALAVVCQVPDVETANAYIRLVSKTAKLGKNKRLLRGTGFENAVYLKATDTWWMLTGG